MFFPDGFCITVTMHFNVAGPLPAFACYAYLQLAHKFTPYIVNFHEICANLNLCSYFVDV